jgi:transcriptional regulator with XRE-family HTH domain
MSIIWYIKEKREQANMTKSELSRLSGVSKAYISEIENGYKEPGVEVLNKLAKALKCKPGDLYEYIE